MTPAQKAVQDLRIALGLPKIKGQIILNVDGDGNFQNAEMRICGITEKKT